jgi:16S rRNA (guanine527-N7)-methyltransferase
MAGDRVTAGAADRRAPEAPPYARALFGPAIGLAERYAGLLAGPGVERGLIGPAEAARLWDRHLINCAVVAGLVPRPATLVDLGSGAGLPGLVLAMLLPDVRITLLEPMARRVAFLEECVRDLGLRNVVVHRGRAEEAADQFAADVVTARAVAPLDRLAGLAVGLVRPGGLVLAIKGAGAGQEVARATPVLRRLGARDVEVVTAGDTPDGPAAMVVRFTAGPARGQAGPPAQGQAGPPSRSRPARGRSGRAATGHGAGPGHRRGAEPGRGGSRGGSAQRAG